MLSGLIPKSSFTSRTGHGTRHPTSDCSRNDDPASESRTASPSARRTSGRIDRATDRRPRTRLFAAADARWTRLRDKREGRRASSRTTRMNSRYWRRTSRTVVEAARRSASPPGSRRPGCCSTGPLSNRSHRQRRATHRDTGRHARPGPDMALAGRG